MAGDLGKDAACCRAGKEWEGEPAGKVIKIAGLDAYVSEPKQAKAGKAVLMIPDIHGWDLKNARLFADKVAAAGYLTVVPDFFHGDKFPNPVTPELFGQWVSRNPFDTKSRTVKEVREVIGELRSAHGVTSLGAQGFCWGGFYAVHLTSLPGDLVQTAIIAHGSKITERMVEAVGKPVLWTCPENDAYVGADFRGFIKKEMEVKDFPTRVDVYPDMEHGFTLRPELKGDASDEALLKESDKALQASIAWFDERL